MLGGTKTFVHSRKLLFSGGSNTATKLVTSGCRKATILFKSTERIPALLCKMHYSALLCKINVNAIEYTKIKFSEALLHHMPDKGVLHDSKTLHSPVL